MASAEVTHLLAVSLFFGGELVPVPPVEPFELVGLLPQVLVVSAFHVAPLGVPLFFPLHAGFPQVSNV